MISAEMSSASSQSPSSLLRMVLLLPLVLLFGDNRKTAFLFGVVLLLVSVSSPADAHNWLNSKSRSILAASTLTPCKNPMTAVPHIQVGPGQTFSIEWMNGHGMSASYSSLVFRADLWSSFLKRL